MTASATAEVLESKIAPLFTRPDGTFQFARWGRAIVPSIFGLNEEGSAVFLRALRSIAVLSNVPISDKDQDLGANFLVFFVREWDDLRKVPDLDKLLPNLEVVVERLEASGSNQYRFFSFEEDTGAIRACLTLLRYDDGLKQVSAQTLAISQCLQAMLVWSETAFATESPITFIGKAGGDCVVKPWFATLLEAAYDPVLPLNSQDPSLALRIAARMQTMQQEETSQ